MSKIIITLIDTENGLVDIKCNPPMPKLVEIARGGGMTSAESYAMAALSKIIQDSLKQKKDSLAGQIIMPSQPGFKLQ